MFTLLRQSRKYAHISDSLCSIYCMSVLHIRVLEKVDTERVDPDPTFKKNRVRPSKTTRIEPYKDNPDATEF